MKLPFTIYDLRFTIWKKSAKSAAFNRQSSIANHKSQGGVALVITLILLSVTLVMALAFLAISSHERGSVSTQTDTATTRLAADAGLAAAEAQIAANVLSATNPYSFGLLVSTNYINYNGFQTGVANPTNVNYDYRSDNQPFTLNDRLQNLENLLISPRPPVFIPNPTNPASSLDFRYYLDLNRNGRFDTNGVIGNIDNNGHWLGTFSFQDGDPEWIGVLERPDQPYGPNNPFIARYAFIALPVGNSLDLNAIHDQTLNSSLLLTQDGYFRNQGVGSWEINLAAFLADLNSDEWDNNSSGGIYQYGRTNLLNFNTGAAFNDAFSLLTNRYAGNYNTLLPVGGPLPGLFTNSNIFPPFQNDIDAYSDGPLQTTTAGINTSGQTVTWPWAGADNTNHYFKPEELFNTSETASFGIHLQDAAINTFGGTTPSTYDRYTFYRMLSQIGTDTTPESGKMNLNYDNLVQGNFFSGAVSETNFIAWTPLAFFTNAADRMLRAYTTQWFQSNPSNFLQTYYGINGYSYSHWDTSGTYTITNDPSGLGLTNVPLFGMTNQIPSFGINGIPVWMGFSSQFVYQPAVQRVLQLAANIYDATVTNYYPSVFRPLFTTYVGNNFSNVLITGYTNVVPMSFPTNDPQLYLPVDAASVMGVNIATNVYGVPWIIGAKKGFPNFNAFTMENVFSITRKLQVTRPNTNETFLSNPQDYTISQQLTLGITNFFGVEFWNSYHADYTHAQPMEIFATIANTMVLTNDEGVYYTIPSPQITGVMTINDWPGYGNGTIPQTSSFQVPLAQYEPALPATNYTFIPAVPFGLPSSALFVTNTPKPLSPRWGLQITNRLRVIMLESSAADGLLHVIDYAQFNGPDSSHDLTADIQYWYDTQTAHNPEYDSQWDSTTNSDGIPAGIDNQIGVSKGDYFDDNIYKTYWGSQDKEQVIDQLDGFLVFFGYDPLPGGDAQQDQYVALGATSTQQQAPYTPTAVVAYITKWEVNDPLVHYLASDLTDLNQSSGATKVFEPLTFGVLNDRYMPWQGDPQHYPPLAGDNSFNAVNLYNRTIKDPLVDSSDNWDFPTNKFPTAGWLGRVHRGTPWQTVYLKSSDVPSNPILITIGTNSVYLPTWAYLNGNLNTFDATNTAPVQDRLLFDLFTTAFNDNATRGTLSVNQSADQYDPVANPAAGLAGWSALFSGIVVPTNRAGGYVVVQPAGPAGVNSFLGQIVTNINGARANFTNVDGLVGAFEHQGDILSAPQLTEQSPFLAGFDATNAISDEMYEWLPQQTMSLLRVGTPRYVIYSIGQALKPAPNGIYLGTSPAGTFGMVTNYQVVSEMSTRTVMRLDTVRTNANGTVTVTPPRAVIESFNILPPD